MPTKTSSLHDRVRPLLYLTLMVCALPNVSPAEEPLPTDIDFGLHIRPILSEHCFHCHGPDPAHREGDLRLDEGASQANELDRRGIVVAGNSSGSELWLRIVSQDPEQIMPPETSRKAMTAQQKEMLRRWIDSGGNWGSHWSLAPPLKKPLPETSQDPWVRSPIDAWTLQAMRVHALSPSKDADPYTMIRRLSLDLIGLPPSPAQVQQFVQEWERSPDRALERGVDELLKNSAFGEHWARIWLDLARYADTKGYEKDLKRDMWPYRDWVIDAFNRDMPFDQFTIEQLAGDLLENATLEQRVATAFHRATLSNDEGGTDDEEFRIAAVKDRIDTTLQVWMGLTMGCAKCHTHKYDPIAIEDYYRFFAIFNQTEDADRYDDEPRIPLPSFTQQSELASLQNERNRKAETLQAQQAKHQAAIDSQWSIAKPTSANATSNAQLIVDPDGTVQAIADRPERDTYVIEFELPSGSYYHLKLDALMSKESGETTGELLGLNPSDPNFVLSEWTVEREDADAATGEKTWSRLELDSPRASFEQAGWPVTAAFDGDSKTGWAVSPRQREPHWATVRFHEPCTFAQAGTLRVTLSQQYGNRLMMRRVRLSAIAESELPPSVDQIPEVKEAQLALATADEKLKVLRESIPRLPILKELAVGSRRTTRVHQRGNFLDPGLEVSAALPPLFAASQTAGLNDRLAAAMWLVDANNPLTPRVMANRVWAQLFGRGLVETEEDFGSQGSLPSHPELLDWLAATYREDCKWSLKQLLRTIVLSRTYRQAYESDDERRERDPRNVWLSRSSRFRLSAETVRDQALAVAGLLSTKVGGPPVMPPQPEGLWRSTYSGARWITSSGDDRFRRGIYTFWKRTTPYPSMEAFDATTREVCQIRRISTNTPLQALVTLNDPVYTEAAIAMAERWLRAATGDLDRIESGFLTALARPIRPAERERLHELLKRARTHYASNADAALKLLSNASIQLDPQSKPDELASWVIVTSTVLNLDEMLMRP